MDCNPPNSSSFIRPHDPRVDGSNSYRRDAACDVVLPEQELLGVRKFRKRIIDMQFAVPTQERS
jgi:hypothetical protein